MGAPPAGTVNIPEAELRKTDDRIKRLEESIRDLEERCNRAEERARTAESRARKTEDELADIRQQTDRIRQGQQEDNEASRQLRAQQTEDKSILDTLKKEMKQDREMRNALEASNAAVAETLQSVLKVADSALRTAETAQQSVLQIRDEKKEAITNINTAVETVEHSTKERLAALELKLDNSSLDALRTMSVPNRIMYLQSLHMQQTGRQLQGGKHNGGSITLLPKTVDADACQKGESHPLLRRVP